MSVGRHVLLSYKRLKTTQKVNTASSKSITGQGNVSLAVWNGSTNQTVVLNDWLHIEGFVQEPDFCPICSGPRSRCCCESDIVHLLSEEQDNCTLAPKLGTCVI